MQPFIPNRIQKCGYIAAVLFNTMFSILASVTLFGIVFITKPKQLMHNVHPEMWWPLLLIIVPAHAICQFLTWKTVFSRRIPSPIEIARHQPVPPLLLRGPLALLWLLNFLIGAAIVVSLFKPAPGRNATLLVSVLISLVTLALTSLTNVYLMLAVRTITARDSILEQTWKYRKLIDVLIALTAVVYYQTAF